ncbi:shikimate dehydrogenase [Hoeflea sp. YIM 152468]|uniref:shikimate dehydrogenase family protein n=1 Tax=Hoeflea sp. YIM 152468 TaxID=3031759 RepID=UPI0023DC9946|nr:ThiF family adenylyltransferase [Hoeflea sp. YIM 152468]MDF1610323.1 shikimate dehydrogenase [Hoeflea sp. YIM 152468]
MISGTTELIAHLGVPTGSFRAPLIYNPWFEANAIDARVFPMGCEAEDYAALLPLLFRLRNIRGALVTMPHKVATVGLLDEMSPAVRISGACNAVRRDRAGRLVGDMFDGEGFVRAMRHKGRIIAGSTALIVGCGGVGSAIAAALAAAGVAELGLYDTRPQVAEALAGRLRRHYPQLSLSQGSTNPAGWATVVNATPLGMNQGDPMPVDVSRIDPSAFVGEVVMKQTTTPFIAAARQRGCVTQVGIDMLFEQIPAYLEFFGFPAATATELRTVSGMVDQP